MLPFQMHLSEALINTFECGPKRIEDCHQWMQKKKLLKTVVVIALKLVVLRKVKTLQVLNNTIDDEF